MISHSIWSHLFVCWMPNLFVIKFSCIVNGQEFWNVNYFMNIYVNFWQIFFKNIFGNLKIIRYFKAFYLLRNSWETELSCNPIGILLCKAQKSKAEQSIIIASKYDCFVSVKETVTRKGRIHYWRTVQEDIMHKKRKSMLMLFSRFSLFGINLNGLIRAKIFCLKKEGIHLVRHFLPPDTYTYMCASGGNNFTHALKEFRCECCKIPNLSPAIPLIWKSFENFSSDTYPAGIYFFKFNTGNTRIMWSLSKVNNKDTRTTSLTSFWYLYL